MAKAKPPSPGKRRRRASRGGRDAGYRGLVHDAALGLCRLSPEGRLLDANAVLAGLLGYRAAADLLAADAKDALFVDAAERAAVAAHVGAEPRFSGLELRWKRPDGRVATVRLTGRALRSAGGGLRAVEAVVEDVTAQRALERQLQTHHRLETIGRLAGGIAHDFNNLLTVILSNASYFEGGGAADAAESREAFRDIADAARRGAALIRQLLAFGRRQPFEPQTMELNPVIEDLGKMLRRLIGEQVRLTEELTAEGAFVRADRAQVEQVILNLALNARDAMPRGGTLTVRTRALRIGAGGDEARAEAPPGSYVALEIADSGEGMDAETLAHLFEPFFTTKARGKGTGLGLASVYGTVRRSGGHIFVRSAPEGGTTFEVLFPAAVPPEGGGEGRGEPKPTSGGTETVLLVEDDDGVRAAARRALQGRGYLVLEARDVASGAALAEAHPGAIHLLIVDVVLADGDGGDLARRLAASRPSMRTLFATGHVDREIGLHGGLARGAALLRKPFTQESLLAKAREVLDARPRD